MSEIRKHYFLSECCIIAEERAKRPSDFAGAEEDSGKSGSEKCLFCAEAEENTPLATAVYKNGKIYSDTTEKRVRNWDFRCFPNLYPALSPIPESPEQHENDLQAKPGYGFHEVIVESPLHGKRLEDFSDSEISGLMQVYRDRTCSYTTREKIRYVSLFKNSGKRAGASINHSHSQLLALPFCPSLLERELKVIRKKEKCPYCMIFDTEKVSSRLIFENKEWIAFTPYYSMGPFEVWILPGKHVSYLGDCSDEILFALGDILKDVLKSYGRILGNPPFNYMFYQLSEAHEYHLNLRLLPRLSINAGFELGTGTYINTVSPERAASYLRGNLKPEEQACKNNSKKEAEKSYQNFQET
jgi:UDPglucose--hexose-1-phosphate uridylyltransferase